MASTATVIVGHEVDMSIVYLDQNGSPMLVTPNPDSPPVWTQTTPADATLSVAPSGLTAVDRAVASGSDLISLTVVVSGITFSTTQAITIQPIPQTLTSISIVSTVV